MQEGPHRFGWIFPNSGITGIKRVWQSLAPSPLEAERESQSLGEAIGANKSATRLWQESDSSHISRENYKENCHSLEKKKIQKGIRAETKLKPENFHISDLMTQDGGQGHKRA